MSLVVCVHNNDADLSPVEAAEGPTAALIRYICGFGAPLAHAVNALNDAQHRRPVRIMTADYVIMVTWPGSPDDTRL